jgi:hypothetical protein
MAEKLTVDRIVKKLLIGGIGMCVMGIILFVAISIGMWPVASYFGGTIQALVFVLYALAGVLVGLAVANFSIIGYAKSKLTDESIPKWLRTYTALSGSWLA